MTTKAIRGFSGEYHFLSNFYFSPFLYEGMLYPTAEHAFQAAKTLDLQEAAYIRRLSMPGAAKRAGQLVCLRYDWNAIKLDVMEEIVRAKFRQNDTIGTKLIGTFPAYLEETNTWGDTYWGVCKGRGENHLGHILMRIRNELINKVL